MDCIEAAVVIDVLVAASEARRARLALRGISIEIHRSDDGPKTGARLDLGSARGLAQIVLWETGELDLMIGDARQGVVLNEHREVSSAEDIDDVLRTVEERLATKGV